MLKLALYYHKNRLEMKAKNQLVVLSGILVLLATATIAATFNVQPANAVQPANTPNAYGKEQIAGTAQTGLLGTYVSSCAVGNPCAGGTRIILIME